MVLVAPSSYSAKLLMMKNAVGVTMSRLGKVDGFGAMVDIVGYADVGFGATDQTPTYYLIQKFLFEWLKTSGY